MAQARTPQRGRDTHIYSRCSRRQRQTDGAPERPQENYDFASTIARKTFRTTWRSAYSRGNSDRCSERSTESPASFIRSVISIPARASGRHRSTVRQRQNQLRRAPAQMGNEPGPGGYPRRASRTPGNLGKSHDVPGAHQGETNSDLQRCGSIAVHLYPGFVDRFSAQRTMGDRG